MLTFDWTQISYIGSPLVYPWWSECNIFAGFILFVCILTPAIYFTNVSVCEASIDALMLILPPLRR